MQFIRRSAGPLGCCALLCGLLGPGPADAANREVVNALDSGPGSLRNMIAIADPGDTIVFNPVLEGQPILLNSELTIDKALTIDGKGVSGGVVLDGQEQTRILQCTTSGRVVLRKLTFRRGVASRGGAVDFQTDLGGRLEIRFCMFEENVAHQQGGAVHAKIDDLTVAASSFVANRASGGSALHAEAGYLFVNNSTFTQNITGTLGGTIHLSHFRSFSLIAACTICGNFADNLATGDAAQITAGLSGENEAGKVLRFNHNIVANNLKLQGGKDNFYFLNVTTQSEDRAMVHSEGYNLTDRDDEGYLDDPDDLVGVEPKTGDLVEVPECPQKVIELRSGSPALDGGSPNVLFPADFTDGRGEDREQDGDCDGTAVIDIGAYEQPKPAALVEDHEDPPPPGGARKSFRKALLEPKPTGDSKRVIGHGAELKDKDILYDPALGPIMVEDDGPVQLKFSGSGASFDPGFQHSDALQFRGTGLKTLFGLNLGNLDLSDVTLGAGGETVRYRDLNLTDVNLRALDSATVEVQRITATRGDVRVLGAATLDAERVDFEEVELRVAPTATLRVRNGPNRIAGGNWHIARGARSELEDGATLTLQAVAVDIEGVLHLEGNNTLTKLAINGQAEVRGEGVIRTSTGSRNEIGGLGNTDELTLTVPLDCGRLALGGNRLTVTINAPVTVGEFLRFDTTDGVPSILNSTVRTLSGGKSLVQVSVVDGRGAGRFETESNGTFESFGNQWIDVTLAAEPGSTATSRNDVLERVAVGGVLSIGTGTIREKLDLEPATQVQVTDGVFLDRGNVPQVTLRVTDDTPVATVRLEGSDAEFRGATPDTAIDYEVEVVLRDGACLNAGEHRIGPNGVGSLTVDRSFAELRNGDIVNHTLIEVKDATFRLFSDLTQEPGARFVVRTGGIGEVTGASASGGRFEGEDGEQPGSVVFRNSLLNDAEIAGNIILAGAVMATNVTSDNARITMEPGTASNLDVDAINGPVEVVLANDQHFYSVNGLAPIPINTIVRGNGTVNGTSTLDGTLQSSGGTLRWTAPAPATNNGTLRGEPDSNFIINVDLNSSGTVRFAPLSQATIPNLTQDAGHLSLDGATLTGNVQANGGTATFNNSVVEGTLLSNTTVSVGFSPGSATFTRDVEFGAANELTMELAGSGGVPGTDFDQLHAGGDLALGGTLVPRLWDGFLPAAPVSAPILTCDGELSGTFASVAQPFEDLGTFAVDYDYANEVVTLTFTPSGGPLTFADYQALWFSAEEIANGAAGPGADFEGDGRTTYLEWVHGGDPRKPDEGGPSFEVRRGPGGTIDLVYLESTRLPPALQVGVQDNAGLAAPWTDLAPAEFTRHAIVPVPGVPNVNRVTLRLTDPAHGNERSRYFRLSFSE